MEKQENEAETVKSRPKWIRFLNRAHFRTFSAVFRSLFVFLRRGVTKRVYSIGNGRALIAHDNNNLDLDIFQLLQNKFEAVQTLKKEVENRQKTNGTQRGIVRSTSDIP